MGLLSTYKPSQRSLAAISSLVAAISFFAINWKMLFLLPASLSSWTHVWFWWPFWFSS